MNPLRIRHCRLRAMAVTGVIGLSLLLLAGCAATQDSPSLYVLNAGASAHDSAPQPNAPTLMVLPVTTASYLDHGGIVYQTGPHRVVVANNNRWASSLASQLTNDLHTTLEQRMAGVNVVRPSADKQGLYRLHTRVDQFLGHYDGKAHITGHWTLVGPEGRSLAGRAFTETVPLKTDGYPALVNSLSHGWQHVGRTMAPPLKNALRSDQGS